MSKRAAGTATAGAAKTAKVAGKNVLILDAREPGEPEAYVACVDDAPRALRRGLKRNAEFGKLSFHYVTEEEMDGLVDDMAEDAEEAAESIMDWLDTKTKKEFEFQPMADNDQPTPIHFKITMAAA